VAEEIDVNGNGYHANGARNGNARVAMSDDADAT
jgi:hypothetical protein